MMDFKRRPYRSPRSNTPLIAALVIVVAAVVLANRLGLPVNSGQPTGQPANAGSALAPVAASKSVPTLVPSPAPTSTPRSTPTATPIPGPAKKTDVVAPTVTAVAAIVIDEKSGAPLYEKSSRLRRAPASITKIVTSIVAIERAKPTDVAEVLYDPDELIDSTLMGLYNYDKVSP